MESNRLIFDEHGESLYAYNNVPYALINLELDDANSSVQKEFSEIERYYNVYRNGAKFFTEGSNGDYTPATLRYKMASSLIRKQARFMFGESPDIVVEAKGDLGKATKETKDALIVMNDLVKTVLDRNLFEDALLKAAKDCFIGKRVAGVVNFNEEDGITVSFLKSTQFLYETKSNNSLVLIKFVAFVILNDTVDAKERRILKKKYTLEDDGYLYIEEERYNGSGSLIESMMV